MSGSADACRRPARWPRRLAASARCGVLLVATLALTAPAGAQSAAPQGRFSLFGNWSQRDLADGSSSDFSELIATLALGSPDRPDDRFDYALDARVATYPTLARDERVSIYEAWVGLHSAARTWSLRLGQVWVHELGGLGAVGGLLAEARLGESRIGSWRAGILGGLEPKRYQAGWLDKVAKGGAYVVLEGDHGRRHVLGWVEIRNDGATERSVVVLTNFVPVGRRLFVYQNAEYDVSGPAGLGDSQLTYVFGSVRWAATDWLQLQGTFHHGRSVDARRITEDHLAGRPVSSESLEGFLFESARLRVTVRPLRGLQVWASAGHDTNNRGDEAADRVGFGLSLAGMLLGGFDLTASSYRIDRGAESYDTTYASLGRSFGSRLYVSLDYTTALSVYRYDVDGGTITVRPQSTRYALSANVNLNRTFSLLLSGETTNGDGYDEVRGLVGLIVRF